MSGITPYMPSTGASSMLNTHIGDVDFIGDGFTETFSISHGLAVSPRYANVLPKNFTAIGDYSVMWDQTNITIMYAAAPDVGPLEFTWIAIV